MICFCTEIEVKDVLELFVPALMEQGLWRSVDREIGVIEGVVLKARLGQ